jgi:SNF2 family DNA or RNA helicase
MNRWQTWAWVRVVHVDECVRCMLTSLCDCLSLSTCLTGKTITCSALLLALFNKKGTTEDRTIFREQRRKDPDTIEAECPLPALVIAPSSILQNWVNELNNWGFFEVKVLSGGGRKSKEDTIELARQRRVEVLIVPYSALEQGRFAEDLAEVHWNIVLFDEGHMLKNEKTQAYKGAMQ